MQMQESIPQKTFIPPSRDQLIGTELSNSRAQSIASRVYHLTGVDVSADQIVELGIRACSNELRLGRMGADNILETLGMEPETVEVIDDTNLTDNYEVLTMGAHLNQFALVDAAEDGDLSGIEQGVKGEVDTILDEWKTGRMSGFVKRMKKYTGRSKKKPSKQKREWRGRGRNKKSYRPKRGADLAQRLSLAEEQNAALEDRYESMPLPKEPKKPSEVRGAARGLLISLCKARQRNLHRQSPERLVSLAEQYERVTGQKVDPIALFTTDLSVLTEQVLKAA